MIIYMIEFISELYKTDIQEDRQTVCVCVCVCMEAVTFTTHLEAAKGKLGIDFPLKEAQVQALESVYEGKNTICLLPTGFSKSVIYQLTPFLLEHKVQDAVTLVISPLNSIMQDQVRNLARRGVKACYLDMRCQSGETYQFALETSCDTDDSETSFGNDSYSNDDVPEEAPEDALLKVSVPIDAMLSEGYQLVCFFVGLV